MPKWLEAASSATWETIKSGPLKVDYYPLEVGTQWVVHSSSGVVLELLDHGRTSTDLLMIQKLCYELNQVSIEMEEKV